MAWMSALKAPTQSKTLDDAIIPQPICREGSEGESVESPLAIDASPARDRQYFIQNIDAASQAAALLDLLQEADYPEGYQLNYAELRQVYREMCTQNRWRARGWISVGRAFDLLTTNGEKPYANFWTEDGRAQRLRVYPIPAKTESISPDVSRAA